MPSSSSHSRSHPRRRAASPSMNPDSLIESLANMSLKKGVTFHSPTLNDSDLLDPFEKPSGLAISRSMTSRSTTCPKELEDLLVGAGERRVVDFLARVDEAVNNKSKEQLGSILSEPDVLPVPAFLVEGVTFSSLPDNREEDQAYDSGLGSSISSEGTIKIEGEDEVKDKETTRKSTRSGSAITRSIAASSDSDTTERLSQHAVEQIHRYIIKPILNEPELKDFHRLIAQVPTRIGDRQITNLRDLEKTLIFLAPDFSRTPAAYLQFCETSIHCLHATVSGVHESEQRLPTDRPYTNHYFLDLVQQIRRYAQILAANRARQAQGEDVDDMEVTPTPLELRDGMTQTGRPAQLGYRTKDNLISLADDQPLPTHDAAVTVKRPMSDEVDDGVERSMARRKKGELPKTYTCPVGGCDKLFNRPCDRTKHLKTHERPHKCSEPTCDFNSKGFPTEKERDRHWSDRHDPNAKTWECHFKDSHGCPYSSKREHNLKSHMEKAHAWEYVRSKGVKNAATKPIKPVNKAKGKAVIKPRVSVASSSSASTPFTHPSGSPSTFTHPNSSTSPLSPFSNQIDPSPMESLMDYNTTAEYNPIGFNPDFADHFNTDIFGTTLAPPSAFPYTPSLSDDRRPSHVSSSGGTPVVPTPAMQGDLSFDDMPMTIPPTPDDLDFSNSLFSKNWTDFGQVDSGFVGCGDNFGFTDESNYLLNTNTTNMNMNTFAQSAQSSSSHPGLRNDPMLTISQNYSLPTDETFGGDATFEGNDFQLDQYISNTGVNEPLFTDNNTFGEVGSQFSLEKPAEANPYKHLFPEFE